MLHARRAWRATCLTAAALLALAACGGDDDSSGAASDGDPVEIEMYYPIAVGGPLQGVVDDLVADFTAENPDITVKPVYSGGYGETVVAVRSSVEAGDAPALTVVLAPEMWSFIDDDMIVPFDDLAETDEEREWLDSFFDAFMLNSRDTEGKTWGIPFQRSTIVQYWNKDAFRAAGLDPEAPPATWAELVDVGKQLQDDAGLPYGVQLPTSLNPYWMLQALTIQNGGELISADGTEVFFDAPETVEALEFWKSMSAEHGVHPSGTVEWGTTPEDFFQEQVGMMWTTTGNLTNVRENAPFDFGVSMLPAGERRGSPVGGGNFYIMKDVSEAEQRAAFELIKFMTQPENTAQWSVATGYVASVPEAWELPEMQDYVEEFPYAAVAKDQLEFAVRDFSTFQQGRVAEAIDTAIEAVLVGDANPAEALKTAQEEADRVLAPYQE